MYIHALKTFFPVIKKNIKLSILVFSGLLLMIVLSVFFNEWRKFFYDNVQAYNSHNVWFGILLFCILALIYVFVYGLTSYYTRFLEFSTREYLYGKYKNNIINVDIKNRDQRLQEDTLRFGRTILSLIKAVVDAGIRLPVFLIILCGVAKPWMVLVVLTYCILGTYGSKKVANKLVKIEYEQEGKEANLRRNIISAIEEKKEMPSLKEVKENWILLAIRNKYLAYYTSFYGQIAVIIPYLMLLPSYLDKVITLGILFQTASAIEQIFASLSVFVDSRDLVVDLQMVTRRLKELESYDNK